MDVRHTRLGHTGNWTMGFPRHMVDGSHLMCEFWKASWLRRFSRMAEAGNMQPSCDAWLHLMTTSRVSSHHWSSVGCAKSDIFGAGVIAFSAACGKHPFWREDIQDVQEILRRVNSFFCLQTSTNVCQHVYCILYWFGRLTLVDIQNMQPLLKAGRHSHIRCLDVSMSRCRNGEFWWILTVGRSKSNSSWRARLLGRAACLQWMHQEKPDSCKTASESTRRTELGEVHSPFITCIIWYCTVQSSILFYRKVANARSLFKCPNKWLQGGKRWVFFGLAYYTYTHM